MESVKNFFTTLPQRIVQDFKSTTFNDVKLGLNGFANSHMLVRTKYIEDSIRTGRTFPAYAALLQIGQFFTLISIGAMFFTNKSKIAKLLYYTISAIPAIAIPILIVVIKKCVHKCIINRTSELETPSGPIEKTVEVLPSYHEEETEELTLCQPVEDEEEPMQIAVIEEEPSSKEIVKKQEVLKTAKKCSFLIASKKIADFCHDNISNAIHGVAIITSIAVGIIQNKKMFAIASVVMLIIGFLSRHGCLPNFVRTLIESYGIYLETIFLFIKGSTIMRILAAITCLKILVEAVFFLLVKFKCIPSKYYPEAISIKNLPSGNLPLEFTKNFLEGEENPNIVINPDHKFVQSSYLLDAENLNDVDPYKLLAMFDESFDLENEGDCELLIERIKKDEKTMEDLIESTDEIPEAEKKFRYVRKQLDNLIKGIMRRDLNSRGGCSDYGILQRRLKYITKEIEGMSLKDKQSKLLDIAVEMGAYCTTRLERVSEEIVDQLMQNSKKVSLFDKILLLLKEERTRLWDSYYYECFIKSPAFKFLRKGFEMTDHHMYNLMSYYIGAMDHGVRSSKEDNLIKSLRQGMGPFGALAMRKYFSSIPKMGRGIGTFVAKKTLKEDNEEVLKDVEDGINASLEKMGIRSIDEYFEKCYDKEAIIEVIKEAMSNEIITIGDVTKWFSEYLQRNAEEERSIEIEDSEEILDEDGVISEEWYNRISEERYDPITRKSRPEVKDKERFIEFMLTEMGIFKIEPIEESSEEDSLPDEPPIIDLEEVEEEIA